jgi:phage-related baseplate assembly protein
MDHLGNAKESEDFYEIDKTLLRSRTQNIEILYNEIIQRYNGNIGQGSMMMANKQDDRLMDFGDEIKNEDCYEMHNGEFFKIDPVENEILYNEIIQRYNGNIGQGSMMMANKQDDRLMDFGDAEDEIDVKIIQEKKLHTSN